MARKQTYKKLISFVNLPLIERLVKDEAEIENRSESAIIEKHLIDSFLPTEKNARCWAMNFLYSEDGGIGQTLNAVFATNAAGVYLNSRYDNLLPIVQFAKTQECFCNTTPNGEERELYHFCSQLDSVCKRLELLSEERPDKKIEYLNEAEWGRELLKEATNEPQFMRYVNIYQLLLNNWEDLKGWSITYRLLSDLAVLEKGWRNSPEARNELLSILKSVSNEWKD